MNYFNQKDINQIVEFSKINFDKIKNKKILITGASGFLGKYFLEYFFNLQTNFNLKFKVTAIDNFKTSSKKIFSRYKKSNISWHDYDIVKKLNIDTKFDYIIFLAGIASPYYYNKFPLETLNISTTGLQNIFNIPSKKNSKVIFFSSSEIYGDPDKNNIPTSETYRGNVSSLGPRSCYDESKRLGETICYVQSRNFSRNSSIIRPFNVYGPGMNINDYRIIPNITKSFITNDQLKIYDKGKQTRTYCHIVDAMNGFLRVIFEENKFSVYNIGNNKNEIDVKNLVKLSEKVMNKKINYKITKYPEEYPADQPDRRCPNINLAKNNLKYIPKIHLKEGLKRHYNFAIENY